LFLFCSLWEPSYDPFACARPTPELRLPRLFCTCPRSRDFRRFGPSTLDVLIVPLDNSSSFKIANCSPPIRVSHRQSAQRPAPHPLFLVLSGIRAVSTMSSASDDGSEYNPDRNRQHEDEEGSPAQPQSSRAIGKGKTSKNSQQAGKQPKGQNKQQPNLSNMPPLPPNFAPYPPPPLGASAQTDDEQARADRQQLYALLRQQVGQGLPQGVSSTWTLTTDHNSIR
jgi:hypothetical protein